MTTSTTTNGANVAVTMQASLCRKADSQNGSLRCEKIEIVQRRDDFAAGEELLQVVAILQRTVAEDPLPEGDRGAVFRGSDVEGGLDHDSLFSTPYANASAPDDPLCNPLARWVANGTRTRNSQNHNLELYH